MKVLRATVHPLLWEVLGTAAILLSSWYQLALSSEFTDELQRASGKLTDAKLTYILNDLQLARLTKALDTLPESPVRDSLAQAQTSLEATHFEQYVRTTSNDMGELTGRLRSKIRSATRTNWVIFLLGTLMLLLGKALGHLKSRLTGWTQAARQEVTPPTPATHLTQPDHKKV
jgi:hypothetical protein